MSKPRKPNNNRARLERASRAALRQSKMAVYNIDPQGRQGLCNWETGIKYRPSRHVADAIFDMPHQWVIYISAFCEDQNGKRYYKSVEIAPNGIYHTDALADVLREHYTALLDSCNPGTSSVAAGSRTLAVIRWTKQPQRASLKQSTHGRRK